MHLPTEIEERLKLHKPKARQEKLLKFLSSSNVHKPIHCTESKSSNHNQRKMEEWGFPLEWMEIQQGSTSTSKCPDHIDWWTKQLNYNLIMKTGHEKHNLQMTGRAYWIASLLVILFYSNDPVHPSKHVHHFSIWPGQVETEISTCKHVLSDQYIISMIHHTQEFPRSRPMIRPNLFPRPPMEKLWGWDP